MSHFHPYVPRFARRWATGRSALAPDLTPALRGAIFVADIAGFTALTEAKARTGQAGIEEMQAILNRCFERIVSIIEEGGGEVYKFAGDATIAWWPADASSARDAVQGAAATALRLQALVPELELAARIPLSLRIGIGEGELYTAILGGVNDRWEAVLGGDALAQVAGADAALPGQVVLSARAFEMLRADCSGRAVANGAFAIDGVTPPLPIEARPAAPEPVEAIILPFVPRHVANRVRASPHGWLAELRFATVLFAAVPAPRDLETLQGSVEVMQRSVYACGGSVVQCLVDDKDKLVLIGAWGIPGSSYANDAERSIRAAHALHAALSASGQRPSVGVASGELFAGLRGAPSRSEFALIGATVNRAARLAEAANGKVWCDEPTSRAANAIAFAALPDVALKGIGTVKVFEPQGRRAQAGADAGELVGRDAELGVLLDTLARVSADPARSVVILVEGEPGIGKSRLCEAFAAAARATGLVVAEAGSEPLDNSTAYRPLRDVMSTLLGLDATLSADARRERVLALMADDPALLDRSSLLATVLDLHLAETPTSRDMSGRGRLDATAELLVHLLHATDSGRPRVVILEDVQWLDSPSWSVVEQAAHHVRGLCLLLTARPRIDNPLPARAVALLDAVTSTRVVLAPLGDAAVREVIAAQLGVSVVPDAIVRLVSDKTQGMPLFVRQVLGTLIDSRTVRIDAGAVRYDPRALAGFSIPDTIRGAVISRIDRLSPRQQFTLKKASVVGRVFTLEALGSADAGDASAEELRADIEAIAARGLVEPGPAPGQFSFSHALIRDAVYSLLPFERRRQLHAALAAWYERRVGDDPEMLGRIGNHYAEAHDPVRAPRALESAGDRALQTGAYREAQSLFRRLVEISATGFGAGSDARVNATDEDLAGWRMRLGLSSYDLGELESARVDLEIAAQLLRDPIPADRAIGFRLGVEIVKALARALLRGARPRQEQTRERQLARVLSALGWIYSLIQRPNHMVFTIVRRFNLLAGGAPSAEQMGAFSGTMYLLMMLGWHRLGDAFAARIVEIQRGLQQPRAYADAIYVVALAYQAQARWEECERHATEAEQIFARLGERRLRMVVIALLANAAELRGAFGRASELYSALLQLAEESGDPLAKCWATGGLAMIAIRQGRFDDGRAMAETAVALARSIGETAADLTSSGSLAICALETGDIERARALVAEGLELLAKMPRLATAQHVLNGLDTFSEAILLLWERDAPVRGSADWKQRAGHAALAMSRMNGYARVFAIGAPAAANRRALEHWLHNRREKAVAMWEHAIAEGERTRIPYETAKAHLELARHLPPGSNDRGSHAEAAARIFELIGAPAGLRRARVSSLLQPPTPLPS